MPMPTSDIDTIANADDLWAVVHAVQETIKRDGDPRNCGEIQFDALAKLRQMADELDSEYGRDCR